MWLPRFLRKFLVLRVAKKLLLKVLPSAAVEDIMGGWKTWAGGIGGIATGVAMIAGTVTSGEFSIETIQLGIGAIVAALGLLGIGVGHKIEKAGKGE